MALYAVILYFLSNMYGGFRIGFLKNSEVIFSQVFATLAANVIIYIELSIMAKRFFVLKMFFLMTIWQIVIAIVWTSIANKIYRSIFPPRRLLLIHGDRDIDGILGKFAGRKDKYNVVHCMHIDEGMEKIVIFAV